MKIKHILSIFLIGACIALPAFSFAQSDACHAKNPANDGNTHNYTCQAKSDKDTNRDLCRGDGSSNSWPELSCGQNTTNVCHRCVCNPPKKRENGRCVSPATKDCQSYNDQTTCLSETCEWKDNKCQNKGTAPKGCSDYKDKPTCPTSNCEWTSSNICQNKIPLEEG
ncbi:MAG: hypothetical protein LBD11_05365 [Candidatus Peribacteria bacterium]|jgi:hypothetical protein|nr:hypothetical protein [Candidatus Peribacteria bacterium]